MTSSPNDESSLNDVKEHANKPDNAELYQHFCNNLYLGQWEISAACIAILKYRDVDTYHKCLELLSQLLGNSYNVCLRSPTLQTSHHLDWLCLQEITHLEKFTHMNKELSGIELSLLLCDISHDGEQEILKEICNYNSTNIGNETSRGLSMKNQVIEYVTDLLHRQPLMGYFLISLVSSDLSDNIYNCFLSCLKQIFEKITDENSYNIYVEQFYAVLSLYAAGSQELCSTSSQETVRDMFELIISKANCLSTSAIYSALCAQRSSYLVEEFTKVLSSYRIKCLKGPCVSDLGLDISAILTDFEQIVFKTLLLENKTEKWRNMFYLCFQHGMHFLENVMNASFSLIKAGEYNRLQELLDVKELSVLKPMVLLLGWNYCYSCSNAKRLLQILWGHQENVASIFQHACKKLKYQVELVQWCLDKSRPLLVASGAPTTRHDRATEMFQGLEAHSLLYVLHHSTQLSSLDSEEVLNILQKRPVSKEYCEVVSQLGKSVRFLDNSSASKEQILYQHDREISIYHSFCALKYFMDAIYFCADSANFSHRRKSFRETSTMVSDSDVSDFQTIYSQQVLKKIEIGKSHIDKIYPLTYRLEILQDIFSLLFVTHEDIQDVAFMPQSDSENEFYEERSLSKAPSLENSFHSHEVPSTLTNHPKDPSKIDKGKQNFSSSIDCSEPNKEMALSFESEHSSVRYDEPFNEEIYSSQNEVVSPPTDMSYKPFSFNITTKAIKNVSGSEAKIMSGELSALSTASTGTNSLSKIGFMVNCYIVRDVLAALKDCAVAIGGAQFGLMHVGTSQKDASFANLNQKNVSYSVKCAIPNEELHAKTSQLGQCISEAIWRFQLVSGNDPILSQSGKVPSTPSLQLSCHNDDQEYILESDEEKASASRRRKFGKHSTEKVRASSVSGKDSESQVDGISFTGKRKKRRHSNLKVTNRRNGIIPKMLASKESLINMCMRRGHFAQANQIIKFFGMEDTAQAKDMEFDEHYSGAVKRLQAIDPRRRQTSPAIFKSRPAVTKINIQAIRTFAAAAQASTLFSSIADEILSSFCLPVIPEHIVEDVANHGPNSEFKIHVNQENIPAMIVLDLACIACRTWDASDSLIDLAHKRMSDTLLCPGLAHKETKKTSNDLSLQGVHGFLNQIRDIVTLGGSESPILNAELWKQFTKCSIVSILTHSFVPVNVASYQAYITALVEIEKALNQANKVLKEVHKINDAIFIEIIQGEKRKPSSSDRPIVHIAIKHLMQVLEKKISSFGILSHFGSTEVKDEDYFEVRNFIQSLYDHVKVLAFLEAECQNRSKDAVMQPFNYFRMLNDSPTAILGKLMFVKKISPYKLEKVAQKLNLNLMKIIVNSCCPLIPCKKTSCQRQPGPFVVESGRVILNDCDNWTGRARHPEVVARELLTKLVTLMKAEALKMNSHCIFDESVAKALLQSNGVWEVFYCTGELCYIDLSQLVDREEKKCFYSNLINIFTIHSFLYHVENYDSESSRNFITLKSNGFEKLMLLNRIMYRVGQLGLISLFDLKYFICRVGLFPPGCMTETLHDRLHYLDVMDPWSKYAPPTEPRLLFVTTDCCESSPPIQVLAPELVKAQLERSMLNYLELNVLVEENKQQVTLPQMLIWHRFDFVGEKEDRYVADFEGLVNFVVAHTSPDFNSPLKRLLDLDSLNEYGESIDKNGKKELPFKVIIQPYKFQPAITFDCFKDVMRSIKCHRRVSSLPLNLMKSISANEKKEVIRQQESSTDVYNLRAVTLEYLKAKSSLCATLISLVCSDEIDDIEEHMDETFYDSQSSEESVASRRGMPHKRTDSDISIVDARSYRYQRLVDDYSSIHQHVLTHIVPLSAAKNPEIMNSSDPVLKLLSTSIPKAIRESMLCMHNSPSLLAALNSIINGLIMQKQWDVIVLIITSLPLITLDTNPDLVRMKDFAICCAVVKHRKNVEPWKLLGKISDSEVLARVVLGTLKYWSASVCRDLLNMCKCLPDLRNDLCDVVKQRLSDLEVYQKITECAKSQKIKISLLKAQNMNDVSISSLNDDELESLTTWQSVASLSEQTPKSVIDVICYSKEFETARKLAIMHNLDSENVRTIEENYILHVLEQKEPNVLYAYQSLETMLRRDPSLTYKLCENLLLRLLSERSILLVAQFILNHLATSLDKKRTTELELICLGAKALLALPDRENADYCHLVSAPKLLIEQLLMNMKIEWVAKAIKSILLDLRNMHECSLSDLDNLIIVYSTKALEFSIIQTSTSTAEDSKGKSSANTSLLQDLDLAVGDKSPSRTKTKSLAPYLNHRRATVAVISPGTQSSYIREDSPLTRYLESTNIPFVMPVDPPPKSKWVPDSAVTECMICQDRFNMFNRRHHCRRCGRVVCHACSLRTTEIRGFSARTCDDCCKQIYDPRPGLTDAEILQQKLKDRLSGNKSSPGSLASSPITGVYSSSVGKNSDTASVTQLVSGDLSWKLQLDEEHNTAIREEFYYQEAPSTSLCISLLQLHSNQNECGQHMLKLCDDLSKMLKPIAPGVANPEVDYNLVISMMKYLLFNAKLKFMDCNDTSGLDQCEQFKGKVDLVNLLVLANCQDIPSILELTKLDAVRRLRDRLIEDERLSLAMEISTKNGIDPVGVWAAWGKACLKMGDYEGARAKFSRCLKATADRHFNKMPSKLICDIVDMIGNQRHQASGKLAFMAQLRSVKELVSEPVRMYTGDKNLDDVQFQECLYYLKTYGTYLALVDFLRRHGYFQKALTSILEKRCSGEVFVDALLCPCLSSGELGKLLEQMVMIDPSLEKWNLYLTASCKHLYRMKYTHVLYELQVFMKDYFRAAMTCINVFYQQDIKSYSDLLNRTNYLLMAKQHMEAHLEMNRLSLSKSVRHSASPKLGRKNESPQRMRQSTDEVARYVDTINQQIEISKFLQKYEKPVVYAASSNVDMSHEMTLPTLFGNSKMKGALAVKILEAGDNIGESFSLALDVITKHKLNAPLIFSQACRHFARERSIHKIQQMLSCITKTELCDDQEYDEVIGACVRVLFDGSNEGKEAEGLIKMIKVDSNKINAFILVGKLKDAYLAAVKKGSIDDVRRIANFAAQKGQTAVKNICESWLQTQKMKL